MKSFMESDRDSKLIEQVDRALADWNQGDVCCDPGLKFIFLADLPRPLNPESTGALGQSPRASEETHESELEVVSEDKIEGLVILTHTCDLVRSCLSRPFVEVAPLVKVSERIVEETRLWKRIAFAYVPSKASDCLVADLDRIMTVEKRAVARWKRVQGCYTDDEARQFRAAIGRKRSRYPFPDEFVEAIEDIHDRLLQKHNKKSEEGVHLRALSEIRVLATPSWDATSVSIRFLFIKNEDPEPAMWHTYIRSWLSKFKSRSKYTLVDDYSVTDLYTMSADDYVSSDRLDLDSASIDRKLK